MLTRRVYSRITIPMEKSKFNIDYRKSDYDFFVTHKYKRRATDLMILQRAGRI